MSECVSALRTSLPDAFCFAVDHGASCGASALFGASPRATFVAEELFTSWHSRGRPLAEGRDRHVRGTGVLRLRDGQVAEKLAHVKG
jgi:hypothetical protein